MREKLPDFFKPLMWSGGKNIDIHKDKADIIMNAINYGTLDHWRWLIKTYGREEIRRVLKKRLVTEFNPESKNLAKMIFRIPGFKHARTGVQR
jgi:hypothetical protein